MELMSSLCMCTETPPNHWFEIVGLMGPQPSCVKTAPRKVSVWLFAIIEQVNYICIFSSVFDTPLDFFGRSLLKQLFTSWYATHTDSPSGHHQWRLKPDEEKKKKERGCREREKKKRTWRDNSLHIVPEKAQLFQKPSTFWPPSFDLMNRSSKATSAWPPRRNCSAIDWKVRSATKLPDCSWLANSMFLCLIKPQHRRLADSN